MYLKRRNVAILTEVRSPRARSMSTSRCLLKCSEKEFPPSLQAQGPASEGSPQGQRGGPGARGEESLSQDAGACRQGGALPYKETLCSDISEKPQLAHWGGGQLWELGCGSTAKVSSSCEPHSRLC